MNQDVTPLLRIRGLKKSFRAPTGRLLCALDGVDLDVYPGETLGLVGESGCGKTTLARCALRLLDFEAGSICFDGTDLRQLSAAALRRKRREFQMVFQDSMGSLDPRMTVEQILAEPFDIHDLGSRDERAIRVRELLSAVALDDSILHRKPATLSGGQQQRVGIARSLALKPRLVVADEPVSALDASVQAQVLNLLVDVQRRFGLTLILISHALSVVHYLCTRVAVMYLGRIIEEAPRDTFFCRPLHPYSRLLMNSIPSADAAAARAQAPPAGELPSALDPPSGCPFHPRCSEVRSKCRHQVPVLEKVTPEGKIACFLYTYREG